MDVHNKLVQTLIFQIQSARAPCVQPARAAGRAAVAVPAQPPFICESNCGILDDDDLLIS